MKNVLNSLYACCLLLLTFSFSFAQFNTDAETKKIHYGETVNVDSATKEDLQERALEWMANQFKTNKFDVNDKVNMKQAHDGTFDVSYTYDFKYKSENVVAYTLTLQEKDGKYKYNMTDFKIYDKKTGPKAAQPLELYYQKMKTDSKKEFSTNVIAGINQTIADLKTAMSGVKKTDKEDW